MVAGRSVRRLLLLLQLLPGLAAVGDHDRTFGVEEKLPVLREMMIVLSRNCCWRRERELPVLLFLCPFLLSTDPSRNKMWTLRGKQVNCKDASL